MKFTAVDARRLAAALLLIPLAVACGKAGPPLPPLERIPAGVGDFAARRFADQVIVSYQVPLTNVDGARPADVARVEVYAVTTTEPVADVDERRLRQLSTLLHTERVRRPLPPPPVLPPPKEGAPAPPPLPLPQEAGVDQGAVMTLSDRLTPEARKPIAIPLEARTERPDKPPVSTDVPPRPLTFVATPGARRYYYAVPVSARGRYGPRSPLVEVPLDPTTSPPPAPRVTYTESELTIAWDPPSDARGVQPPPLPDVLPSKPLLPGVDPTMYDVYEVSKTSAGNVSPTAPLIAEAIGEREVKQAKVDFGVERCFVVRAVDLINGVHVRSEPSPVTCATPVDTFPPAPPESLEAVGAPGVINLVWDANDEPDLGGYLVLRAEVPGDKLTQITPQPLTTPAYRDTNITAGVRYVYAVIAVDKAGNRSGESPRQEATARP